MILQAWKFFLDLKERTLSTLSIGAQKRVKKYY